MKREATETPWRTPHWFCSPHNFDPAIRVPPHRVELHDITVRDGEGPPLRPVQLTSSAGVVVALSGGEYRLLKVFLEHPNHVLTRDQLLDLTRGRESTPFDRSIDVQVGRLRRRLGDTGQEPVLIKTVRGEGYVLAATVEAQK